MIVSLEHVLQQELIRKQSIQSSSSKAKYCDLEALGVVTCVGFNKNMNDLFIAIFTFFGNLLL